VWRRLTHEGCVVAGCCVSRVVVVAEPLYNVVVAVGIADEYLTRVRAAASTVIVRDVGAARPDLLSPVPRRRVGNSDLEIVVVT
jgi:hypothetical protein